MGQEQATFAAGCFWGPEVDFRAIPGVLDASVGYTGGEVERPSYELVCSGTTGHAEAVNVTFDPDQVSYEQLVDAFFAMHDPTQVNRQGPDIGTQYRSAIFTHSEEQQKIAEAALARAQARWDRPIATLIEPAADFWEAEDYHQRFFEKKGIKHHR